MHFNVPSFEQLTIMPLAGQVWRMQAHNQRIALLRAERGRGATED